MKNGLHYVQDLFSSIEPIYSSVCMKLLRRNQNGVVKGRGNKEKRKDRMVF